MGTEGKEWDVCANGEKDTLRGTRTHTFYYPGRCPNSVRLEETSQSLCIDANSGTVTLKHISQFSEFYQSDAISN